MENLLVVHSLAATSLLLVVLRAISDLEVPAAVPFAKSFRISISPLAFIPSIAVFVVVWFFSVLGVFLTSIDLAAVAKKAAPFLWGATAVGTFLAILWLLLYLYFSFSLSRDPKS